MVDERIVKFIKRHHVMTSATADSDGLPYCANLFYSYMPTENLFVFTTDPETRHGSEMAAAGFMGGSIVLETRTVGRVQGLQIQGTVTRAAGEIESAARKSYIKRFPYAAAAELNLWTMKPTFMKFTDNTLGFGKKLVWQDQSSPTTDNNN